MDNFCGNVKNNSSSLSNFLTTLLQLQLYLIKKKTNLVLETIE